MFILLLFAFVFACLAMLNVPSHPRFNWLGATLAFWLAWVIWGSKFWVGR
jgi:hypothetical protein